MASVIWAIVAGLILVFFWWANRLLARENAAEKFDAGLAIIEFGRAYPDEAIRQVMITTDASMIFLRLWDGRAGTMRPSGNHYQCHIVKPGFVRVEATDDPKSLLIEFPGTRQIGGIFEFRTPREASEVSLWLLGSFVPSAMQDYGMPSLA